MTGRVTDSLRLGTMQLLRVSVPGWRPGSPGQFALVQPEGSAVFLPRAFSIHGQAPDEVSFLIAPIGAGTAELARVRPGDEVWVLGPLGRGFDLEAMSSGRHERLVVVAGGVGAAPFPLLLESLTGRRSSFGEVLVLVGFRDALQAQCADSFAQPVMSLRAQGVDVRLEIICEDGSLGRAGLVTALLSDELRPGDVVVACGAHAMCEAVWQLCQLRECSGWFSLEAGMACGVGSCHGCALSQADGSLTRVCRQGPVFAGETAFGNHSHPCTPAGDPA